LDRTGILRRIFGLKFKRRRPMGQPRTGWFNQVLLKVKEKKIMRRGKRLETFYLSAYVKHKWCYEKNI
jgi:hypothetical protein